MLVGIMGRRLVPTLSFGPGWLWWVWLGLLGASCGSAQQVSPANDASITTLHVYTTVAEVPTLVLTRTHKEMNPVQPAQFRLSLDSGPAFQPTHVRMEGDDPISMAILIDTMVPKSELLPKNHDRADPYFMALLVPIRDVVIEFLKRLFAGGLHC